MRRSVGYGIDFGTSNSSIAIAYDDGTVDVLEVTSGEMPHSLPSIAHLHRNGNRLAGSDAVEEYLITGSARTTCDTCSLVQADIGGRLYSDCHQFSPGSFCNDSRLMYGLKSELSNDTFKRTHSWAVDFEMSDLVSIILSHLKELADKHSGSVVDRVVLGMPVAFVGTEGPRYETLQELAEKRLVESAYAAGFREVEPFPEPAAAIMDQPLDPGYTVAVDFGGGTFDIAVIEMPDEGGAAEIIGLQGATVGGSDFDALIFDHAVAEQVGVDRRLPAFYQQQLRTLMGVRWLLADKNLRAVLAQAKRNGASVDTIEEIIYGGHAHAFYKSIEEAKVALSTDDHTVIAFTRPGVKVRSAITRREFEDLIRPHVDAVDRAITHALEQGGVDADSVHTVVRTGGSSEIPAFLRLVSSKFSNAEIRPLPVFTAVAKGLGVEAESRWRDA